jgi:hypothetical protein
MLRGVYRGYASLQQGRDNGVATVMVLAGGRPLNDFGWIGDEDYTGDLKSEI